MAEQNTVDRTAHRERERLLGFVRRRVRNESDAEDIVQEVFYQLATSYNVAEPIEKLTAWLFRVARNKVIDWYRRRQPGTVPLEAREGEGLLSLEEILFDADQDPDRLYERSLVWTELADALDDLPEEQQEVFVLHQLEGKSFKEIAEITGEPLNTLLARKRYAVLYLRERLQELFDEFDFV
ncbi:RNA polymerase sigma factor [bacterium]|nr:MAG: RNA polymerase sigma factor [bacterium]